MLGLVASWYDGSAENWWVIPVHDETTLCVLYASARAYYNLTQPEDVGLLESILGSEWTWFVERDETADQKGEFSKSYSQMLSQSHFRTKALGVGF